MSRGAGGELALGSLSSAPGNTCPKVSGIAGAPSWGPQVPRLVSQLSADSTGPPAPCPPHTLALAVPRVSDGHQLFSCCISALSPLVPRKVSEDKSLGLLPPADREQAGAWAMRAQPWPPSL